MTIQPIRTDAELRAVFHRLEGIFQADEGTPEADERDVLVTWRLGLPLDGRDGAPMGLS